MEAFEFDGPDGEANLPLADMLSGGSFLDPFEEMVAREDAATRVHLLEAVQKALTLTQWEILQRDLGGERDKDIAQALQISVSTVKMHLQAARKIIRNIVA
jgi:DNA-binding NarL/FixJ family response regulator